MGDLGMSAGPFEVSALCPFPGAPGTLWVGSVWPRSAWLHWDTLHTPADGYELEYGPPGGPQQVTAPQRSLKPPGTPRVSPQYTPGNSNTPSGIPVTPLGTPITPQGIPLPSFGYGTSIHLRGTTVMPLGTSIPPRGVHYPPGISQYPSCPQTLWLPPEATSQQLWGLEPAERYGVRLWGRGGDPQTAPLEAIFDTREWGELGAVERPLVGCTWTRGSFCGGVGLLVREAMPLGGRAGILGGTWSPQVLLEGVGGSMGGGHPGERLGYGGGASQSLSPFGGGGLFGGGGGGTQTPGSFGCWCPGMKGLLGIWVLWGGVVGLMGKGGSLREVTWVPLRGLGPWGRECCFGGL